MSGRNCYFKCASGKAVIRHLWQEEDAKQGRVAQRSTYIRGRLYRVSISMWKRMACFPKCCGVKVGRFTLQRPCISWRFHSVGTRDVVVVLVLKLEARSLLSCSPWMTSSLLLWWWQGKRAKWHWVLRSNWLWREKEMYERDRSGEMILILGS